MNGWQVAALGSAFFAALTALFGKMGVSEMNSNLATFYRTLIIVAVTAAVVTLRGEWVSPERVSARGLSFLALSGVATGLSWLCYYRALQLGPASRVAPVDKLSVVIVMILAFGVLGEPITWRAVMGGALVAAGAILLALG